MSIAVKVAGQSAYFLAGNLFTLVVGFLFQIYLTNHLHADGVGLFGLLEAGYGIFTSLLGLGIAQVALRFIPEHLHKKEYAEIHSLVRWGFSILFLVGLIGMAAIYFALPLITEQWPELADHRKEVLTASLIIPIAMMLFLSAQVLRGFYDIRYVVMGSSFLQLSAKVVGSLLFFSMGMMVQGYIWAVVLSTAIALAWMLLGILRHLSKYPPSGPVPLRILPEWRAYARVMYANVWLSVWLLPLERGLLASSVSVGAVGVMVVARMLYSLPAIFLQMFLSIVAPMLASSAASGNSDEIRKIYQLSTDWLVRVSLPLLISLAVFSEPILKLFGEQFANDGTLILRILLMAQLINILCGPLGSVMNMCGFEKRMLRVNIIGESLQVLLLIIVIPLWGLTGAGLVSILAVIYSHSIAYSIARREIHLYWLNSNVYKWLIPGAAATLIAFLVQWSFELNLLGIVASILLIYLVFHSLSLLLYGLNKDDQLIYQAVKDKFGFS